MDTSLQTQPQGLSTIVTSLVLEGDLSKMDNTQRVQYYNHLCNSLGLNPLTQPFSLLKLDGKLVMYAKKDATDQLRKVHGISVMDMEAQNLGEVYLVKIKVKDKEGRTDLGTGLCPLRKEKRGNWVNGNNGGKGYYAKTGEFETLSPEELCNAIMKAETKAKRRATLSICGLGMLDESELDTVKNWQEVPVEEVAKPVQQTTPAKPVETIQGKEEIQSTPEPAVRYATQVQKDEIIQLLNHALITRQEKVKMLLNVNRFDEDRATQAIEKLKKTIEDRESGFSIPEAIRATSEQKAELTKLIQDEVITEQEADEVTDKLDQLTQTQAIDLLVQLKQTIVQRKTGLAA